VAFAFAGAHPPAAPSQVAEPRVGYEDFVGAAACGECHAVEYAAWSGSTHGRAGGVPNDQIVIAPFDGTPIRFRDAVVIPARSAEGFYSFRVEREGRETVRFSVDGVVGRGHMNGGGTQGFLSRFPDGTVRFLPFDFSRDGGVWFCNTTHIPGQWTSTAALATLRAGRGWVPIGPDMRLTDCGDWPPVRVMGADDRLANCQGCHGSRITLAFDTASRAYRTRIGSLGVDCESCHGPGRAHTALMRSGHAADSTDLHIGVLDTLGKDASLDVCFQCHALKHVLEPGFLPGEDLERHFSLLLPLVGAQPFHPDGRIRTFAYQQNHRASDCYLNGSMTCVDCHEPHAQGYRSATGEHLPGRFDEGQCLGCHPAKAQNPATHTHHAPASEGSRCVSCHMPYLQQPEVGDLVRYSRSDHTISIPRPLEDAALGLRGACAGCHADLSVQQLDRTTQEWYGEMKPRSPVVASLMNAGVRPTGSTRDPARPSAAATGFRLQPGERHPMAQVMSLDHVLENVLPGLLERDEAVDERMRADLRRMAVDPDADVRAVALATLQLGAGDDDGVRSFLRSALERDTAGLVRARWVLALGLTAESYRARGDVRLAIMAYSRALEIDASDSGTLLGLAVALGAAGADSAAIEVYRRAIAVRPYEPVAWVNLGLELENLGHPAEAEAAWEQALALNPRLGLARMNLGNARLRRGENPAAIQQYELAVAAEPWLARAWFYMGVALVREADRDGAIRALRSALEFAPDDEEIRAFYEQLVGRTPINRRPDRPPPPVGAGIHRIPSAASSARAGHRVGAHPLALPGNRWSIG